MFLSVHRQDDLLELREVIRLARKQGIPLEERNDFVDKISPSGDGVCHHAAIGTFRRDVTTAEEIPELIQEFQVIAMLIDLEDVSDHAPASVSDRRMRSDAYVEATFAIDEPRYVAGRQFSRPSLLIARTGRIVTVIHVTEPIDQV